MRNLLLNIGKKSKKAFSIQLNSKKKDKVLKELSYFQLFWKPLVLVSTEGFTFPSEKGEHQI